MWILYAFCGSLVTSLTSIFSKIGLRTVKPIFATFIRSVVAIILCLIFCSITHSFKEITGIGWKNYLFMGLASVTTAFVWIFYNKALKEADVSKVLPIDRAGFILTSLLYMIFYFRESTYNGSVTTVIVLTGATIIICFGVVLMVKGRGEKIRGKKWILYAVIETACASFSTLFLKMGVTGISTGIATLIKTVFVCFLSGMITLIKKDYKQDAKITLKTIIFLILAGITTGGVWFFELAALNTVGSNPVVVNGIIKMSLVLTMLFSVVVLKEKISPRARRGLLLFAIGLILIIIFGRDTV